MKEGEINFTCYSGQVTISATVSIVVGEKPSKNGFRRKSSINNSCKYLCYKGKQRYGVITERKNEVNRGSLR